MTAPNPELVTAARTLLHWAQARQTVWRDPSTEIIAALGNRYQAFMDQAESEPGPLPPPPPTSPLPPPAPAAYVASAPSAPVSTHPTPPPPAPIIPPEPVVQSRPSIIPPKPSAPRQVWRPMPSETRRSEVRLAAPQPAPRSKAGWMWGAMAAVAIAIVVAVVAAPRFKHREPPRTAVTPQTGTLTLESTPPGSTVLVDGAERGTTPMTVDVAPGTHSVQFRYRKNVRTVDVAVAAGEAATQSVDWTRKPRPRPATQEAAPAAAPPDEPKVEEPAAAEEPAVADQPPAPPPGN